MQNRHITYDPQSGGSERNGLISTVDRRWGTECNGLQTAVEPMRNRDASTFSNFYAASRSGKQSERCWSSLSTAGFTLMWNEARSRASFGPITVVNLSTVVLKSLACISCNSIVIVMSNNPPSRSFCALCASKLPPSIRAKLTTERLLHAVHSSPRLLLMTSQSRQRTAFESGRTPASRWFLVPANICTNPCR